MIKILDSEKKIFDNDISLFEDNYNILLPDNYKEFIKKYNGGYTEDSDLIDKILSIKYGKVTVELLINTHQILEENILENYLPIALDWSDNPITINLNEGNEYGKIVKFYFDTDEEPEIIANSLEELFGVESIGDL